MGGTSSCSPLPDKVRGILAEPSMVLVWSRECGGKNVYVGGGARVLWACLVLL